MLSTIVPKLNYSEILKELERKSPFVLLDVREKGELLTDGKIPTSKNMPRK